jgi:4-diphosphocytidyl-2-C-methyl-D-erythritol kinase
MENERSEGYVNDFEDLVFSRFPRLRLLHDLLLRSGAELARMSGTGSSLFALYRKEENALGAAKTLASDKVKVYVQSLPA